MCLKEHSLGGHVWNTNYHHPLTWEGVLQLDDYHYPKGGIQDFRVQIPITNGGGMDSFTWPTTITPDGGKAAFNLTITVVLR